MYGPTVMKGGHVSHISKDTITTIGIYLENNRKINPELEKSGKRQRDALMHLKQGDQIGRIFAKLLIVYFGYFFDNRRSSSHFCANYFHS
jgi:hypothetical protein